MRAARLVLEAAIACVLFAPAAALSAPARDSAQSVAHAVVERFASAWNRYDGAAFTDEYLPDAEFVDPNGGIHEGRVAIERYHVQLWSGPLKGTRQQTTLRKVRELSPDVMVLDFDAVVTGQRQTMPGQKPGAPVTVHVKYVMQHRGGAWKVAEAQLTRVVTAPPAK